VKINNINGMGYVKAKRESRGYKLYYVGTWNEVYPGELFCSANEARMYHAVNLIKQEKENGKNN